MSSAAGQSAQAQQLRQDIQQELTTANQLASLISNELRLIKNFTNPGGPFELIIMQNASLVSALANAYQIDMSNIPPLVRKTSDLNTNQNQNHPQEEHNTLSNDSEMDDAQ